MNKEKQIMDEFEIYESLIRKNAKQKYIDCQMDRVIETIKKSQREEIVEKIEKMDSYQDREREWVGEEMINKEEIINLITKEDETL